MKKISLAIITHHAKHHLPFCLPPILQCALKPRILLVNSSSEDGTVELAKQMGVETLIIPRKNFNHGTTREEVRRFLGGDIVIMMSPDAYGESSDFLEKLIAPIVEDRASVSYARQLPHKNAEFFEAFPRFFNYPDTSEIRTFETRKTDGSYTLFCSNSCSAWSQKDLDEIGGFKSVLMGEDALATAELLKIGKSIAYVAEARIRHSHHYSLQQEFKRHFDIGLSRMQMQAHLSDYGNDTARGKKYAKEMLAAICKNKPLNLPYGCLHIGAKWLGYQMGKWLYNAPKSIKRQISSQDFYWDNI